MEDDEGTTPLDLLARTSIFEQAVTRTLRVEGFGGLSHGQSANLCSFASDALVCALPSVALECIMIATCPLMPGLSSVRYGSTSLQTKM